MNPQVHEALTRFFQGLLQVLGEEGRVEIQSQEAEVYVNLVGGFRVLPQDDQAFREALGRLAALHLRLALKARCKVEVDINGQEETRRRELVDRALALAERVKREKRPLALEPMPPKDRRLIHLALAEVPGVRTRSVGEDENRRVIIEPAGD